MDARSMRLLTVAAVIALCVSVKPIWAADEVKASEPLTLRTNCQDTPTQPDGAVNTAQGTDPDTSPEILAAWHAWHKSIAQKIFERFKFLSTTAFKDNQPLQASLTYDVTADRHIVNMNMTKLSTNVRFNVLVYQAVKSLDGDSVLAFPPGSKRKIVRKVGNFRFNHELIADTPVADAFSVEDPTQAAEDSKTNPAQRNSPALDRLPSCCTHPEEFGRTRLREFLNGKKDSYCGFDAISPILAP